MILRPFFVFFFIILSSPIREGLASNASDLGCELFANAQDNSALKKFYTGLEIDPQKIHEFGLQALIKAIPTMDAKDREFILSRLKQYEALGGRLVFDLKDGTGSFAVPSDPGETPILELDVRELPTLISNLKHELGHFESWNFVRARLKKQNIANPELGIFNHRQKSPAHIAREVRWDEENAVKRQFGKESIHRDFIHYPDTEAIRHGYRVAKSKDLDPLTNEGLLKELDYSLESIAKRQVREQLAQDFKAFEEKKLAQIKQIQLQFAKTIETPTREQILKEFLTHYEEGPIPIENVVSKAFHHDPFNPQTKQEEAFVSFLKEQFCGYIEGTEYDNPDYRGFVNERIQSKRAELLRKAQIEAISFLARLRSP